ncbi:MULTISPECIES: nucleotide 5'-monophosphate nucleosidase PpnN [unclassified Undibacterium]|uniref:nucleotide 5'-monophosphate nucleosidase PpnN n=1 Tax=unclassified Undibacterium TaxID=2630295 RepID=UPI002AC99F4B|nr:MULTISPECIES: nucleotide 5'-monophosphate nucleosidase PpnN [unclassified Undibacterium]MEB0140260.1 nucleotide 5'-monophosphate nucleosidase PpnN [Undibacterium sp. CCC2.1]MEB0173291.1 nucleotide 5'-monophosphate nucleosidase PpnN [Undibacterium sp. CCC1.1]MEB0177086.1 nucleotide 5'-monophosphate nucleosidase PpnN [Undibacterium sp. CCC3.4]MEB0216399.1 nucleotide 5'-monophosphate nucleosidase PpnN [Undibacterium sp. 5I2]WPX43007.1 nucleotide 5'-monophosphate nucleosidase PpnN [Undibacteriu
MEYEVIDTQISPEGRMEVLSKLEVAMLLDHSHGGLYQVFRNCALAVLNCGSGLDDGKELLERYKTFQVSIIERERGIKLEVKGAPASAFVNGVMIKGIQEHLFAVLRDILFIQAQLSDGPFDLVSSEGITDAVFHVLRNANLLHPQVNPNLVVCWGGHSISGPEYDYTKQVGYELGLRALDICTGCGPGAMKGPMKGATIGHAKQRITHNRYLGFTEPGIIAAEAPNPIVNELVILPDIEKRLEAFVRCGHAVIVFPGGAGTAEEILYLLGILLHPDNADMPFPLIFTGPASAAAYFTQIDRFIADTLGAPAQALYQIIIGDPVLVAQTVAQGIAQVRAYRKAEGDAYYFNWMLKIDAEFQKPFEPTHQNMRNLALHKNQERHLLAANLRRAFSGIVAGNVKNQGIRAIEQHGHFEIAGDTAMMEAMDSLLTSFVVQNRMKLPGKAYTPCYRVIK